jgi:hypothetical protein
MSTGQITEQFSGIYPMLYAFFDQAGHLDRGAMRAQVRGALAQGCMVSPWAAWPRKPTSCRQRNAVP